MRTSGDMSADNDPLHLRIRLRVASSADVLHMAAIEAEAFSDPWPASAFSSLLTMDYARLTVAERFASESGGDDEMSRARELVGYCIVVVAADEGEIANIAVRADAQGTGIGARLLDNALTNAVAEGVTRLFLEVRASNEPAKALYHSRSFRQIGRRRAYYRDPVEDAFVLRWDAPVPAP